MKIDKKTIAVIAVSAAIVIGLGVKFAFFEDKPLRPDISADFPFESKYVHVIDSNMHYVEEGQGQTVLFIHGNPTSSYLWRNIIPHVSDDHRVIAVDLIGMGKSDKPDIDYTYDDHYRYLEGFINEMELTNVTLVIHDWGSGLGFNYAMNNPENIRGIAFMESLLQPMTYEQMGQQSDLFKKFRDPVDGKKLLMEQNMFVEKLLPSSISRQMTEKEMEIYREPYLTYESRKPVYMWPNQVPIDGDPKHTHDIIVSYNEWLQTTDFPKMYIYATPGGLGNEESVQWAKDNLKNLDTAHVGDGFHFIQEEQPEAIGQALDSWLANADWTSK